MPQVFGQFFQIKPFEDIIECFSTHIRSENLTPALFQFTVAVFTQKCKGTQLLQFIAQVRILISDLSGLIFQLIAQVFHIQISFCFNFINLQF